MCVNHQRSSLLSRSGFIGAVSAAALPLFSEPARALDAVAQAAGSDGVRLPVPAGLSAANTRAAQIATASPFIRVLTAQAMSLAQSIGDSTLRSDVVALLLNPAPRYIRRYRTPESRVALRDALARAGFVATDAPVEGIVPPVSETGLAQPFWSAPGSDTRGHHSYPGGLCAHELFNARMATQFAQTYDRQYLDSTHGVSTDIAIAAAFYHDIMKAAVFQYRDDGTFFDELQIAGTGGHHCLSGAEAIAHGHSARFVTVLLSAHAAPSLGDEAKVVTWCRAAAMIAGVDPVEYGLLKKERDGYALAQPPPVEAFVNHLSDHDYVLAIHAARAVRPMLDALAPQFGVAVTDVGALNWWKLRICSHVSEIALYHELTKSEDAFARAVKRVAS